MTETLSPIFAIRPQRAYSPPVMAAAIRYLFHRHHLSKRMLGLISEYGGKR